MFPVIGAVVIADLSPLFDGLVGEENDVADVVEGGQSREEVGIAAVVDVAGEPPLGFRVDDIGGIAPLRDDVFETVRIGLVGAASFAHLP